MKKKEKGQLLKDQLREVEELKKKVIALRKKGLTFREIEEKLEISPFNYEVELAKIKGRYK